MGITRFATRSRPVRATLGLALCLGAVLACPGCVDYQGTVPCESDSDCGRAQVCDLTQGICRPMSCIQACQDRECGPDGCGGSCGACAAGETCSQGGQCLGACSPDCSARECGPDGCGGSCGTCPAGEACTPVGVCGGDYPCCETRECGPDPCMGVSCGACLPGETCTPAGMCEGEAPCCGNRECGPDPCAGVSCGECMAGMPCTPSGICMGDAPCCENRECGPDPCLGLSCGTCGMDEWCDANGRCQGVCTPDCTGRQCGDDGCGGSCGTCAYDEWCNDLGICVWECQPDCTGKECGPDGCGGSCGTCAPMQVCDATARCVLPGNQQAGEPCDFDTVNVGAGECMTGLVCLGVLPDPTIGACTTDGDCVSFLDPLWNPDCVGGYCGASFCSPECENGACDPGFQPQYISGLCMCIPYWQDPDPGLPGDPCAWDQVNSEAGNCEASLLCLGIPPDPLETPCPAGDGDCLAFYAAAWNPDCVDGGCGVSFCSESCTNGGCITGFEPIDISGDCYCVPLP